MSAATQWRGGSRVSADDALLIKAMIAAGLEEPPVVNLGWPIAAGALWSLVVWTLFFKALLSLL